MGGDSILSEKYFPQGTFEDAYCSPYLLAMDEPSLSNMVAAETEVYRFLWLRTFHQPIAIRVQNFGDRLQLWSKQLDGKGGYEPGRLIVSTSRSVTAVEWATLMKHIEQASFWALVRLELERADVVLQEVQVDGAFWVLEGVRNRQYHFLDRCSPQTGDFRDCCLYLLELSGLKADPIY